MHTITPQELVGYESSIPRRIPNHHYNNNENQTDHGLQ